MHKKIAAFFAVCIAAVIMTISISAPVVAQQNYGSNWSASIYSDTNFTTLVTTRVDQTIAFAFGQSGPNGLVDNFSIRWTGSQTFNAGTYTFTVSRDENARVIIDGVEVIPFQGAGGPGTFTSAAVSLAQGQHTVTVEYREFTGDAYIYFYWTAGTTATAGPTLTPSTTAPPPIPAGAQAVTVIRASVLNVRDAPSLGGNVVGRIRRGERYQVLGRDADARWFLLQLSGRQGWAYGYYLAVDGNEFNPPVASPFGTIGVPAGVTDTGTVAQAESTLRLRAQPNVASAQIGRVTWGGFLPVIARTADGYWYQVVWKGTVGWIYSPFVEIIQGSLNAVPIIR